MRARVLLSPRHCDQDGLPVPSRHPEQCDQCQVRARLPNLPCGLGLWPRDGSGGQRIAAAAVCGRPLLSRRHAVPVAARVLAWHVYVDSKRDGSWRVHGLPGRKLLPRWRLNDWRPMRCRLFLPSGYQACGPVSLRRRHLRELDIAGRAGRVHALPTRQLLLERLGAANTVPCRIVREHEQYPRTARWSWGRDQLWAFPASSVRSLSRWFPLRGWVDGSRRLRCRLVLHPWPVRVLTVRSWAVLSLNQLVKFGDGVTALPCRPVLPTGHCSCAHQRHTRLPARQLLPSRCRPPDSLPPGQPCAVHWNVGVFGLPHRQLLHRGGL